MCARLALATHSGLARLPLGPGNGPVTLARKRRGHGDGRHPARGRTGCGCARQPEEAPAARRIGRLSTGSWVLYDLANTTFSLGVITLFYPQLLRDVFGYGDAVLGTLDAIAAAPDVRRGARARRSVGPGATAPAIPRREHAAVRLGDPVPGRSRPPSSLFGLFVVATVCFQAGLIFYDSLLPEVSTDANRGRVGGLGVGVGYGGSLIAFAVGSLILAGNGTPTLDRPRDRVPGACRRVPPVRDPGVPVHPRTASAGRAAAHGGSSPTHSTRCSQRRVARGATRGWAGSSVGRMFYADAANTLIFMVVLYAMGLPPARSRQRAHHRRPEHRHGDPGGPDMGRRGGPDRAQAGARRGPGAVDVRLPDGGGDPGARASITIDLRGRRSSSAWRSPGSGHRTVP